MAHSITFLAALFICSVMIPSLVRWSSSLGIMDHPDTERKSHDTSTSRAGGIAIAASAAIALTLPNIDLPAISGLLFAGLLIFAFGLLDDVRDLHYMWKFVGQFLAAIVAIASGVSIGNLDLPLIGQLPEWSVGILTFVFIVGVTNAVNLSDGLDGLAGGSTFLSLSLIALLSYFQDMHTVTLLSVAIMGGIAGFLRFNTQPAVIFMGDSGSQFIGFMAACTALLVTSGEQGFTSTLPLLILGLPILDTCYVMLVRLKNKKSPFEADDSHLHHRLVRLGLQNNEAVAAYYCIQIVLLAIAYGLRRENELVTILYYLGFCATLIFVLVTTKQWKLTRQDNISTEDTERRNAVFRRVGDHYRASTSTLVYALLASLALAVVSTIKISSVGPDTIALSFIILLALLCTFLIAAKKGHLASKWLLRLIASCSAAVVFYHASLIHILSNWRYLLDFSLLATLVFLALCVRVSRKTVFSLTTQDLLIVLVLLAIQIIPIDERWQFLATRITIFLFIVEYLIAIKKPRRTLLNVGCMVALLAVTVISFL